MTAKGLPAPFIEYIHDVLVSTFLPYDETIPPGQYRDQALIESAVGRPFSAAFGVERWPSLPEKAAALFHSLACNHCFLNGNKRTAVIALDLFLALNEHLFTMNSDEVYELARRTATANAEGRSLEDVMAELSRQIGEASVSLQQLQDGSLLAAIGREAYDKLLGQLNRRTHVLMEMLKDILRTAGVTDEELEDDP